MTYNERMIREHISTYKKMYFDKFGQMPKSWFTFFRWLADCTQAQSFNSNESALAIKLFEDKTDKILITAGFDISQMSEDEKEYSIDMINSLGGLEQATKTAIKFLEV